MTDRRRHRDELERSWHELVERGLAEPAADDAGGAGSTGGDVRDEVRASWERSAHVLEPTIDQAPIVDDAPARWRTRGGAVRRHHRHRRRPHGPRSPARTAGGRWPTGDPGRSRGRRTGADQGPAGRRPVSRGVPRRGPLRPPDRIPGFPRTRRRADGRGGGATRAGGDVGARTRRPPAHGSGCGAPRPRSWRPWAPRRQRLIGESRDPFDRHRRDPGPCSPTTPVESRPGGQSLRMGPLTAPSSTAARPLATSCRAARRRPDGGG